MTGGQVLLYGGIAGAAVSLILLLMVTKIFQARKKKFLQQMNEGK